MDLIEIASLPWVGTFLSVAGLLLAGFAYKKTRRIAQISVTIDEAWVVGSSEHVFDDRIKIEFDGIPVPHISAARLALWNSGNTTVRGDDIVQSDPLEVRLTESSGQLLRANIISLIRQVNGIHVMSSLPTAATILFDFIDPGDGVTLEIIHTAPLGSVELGGTICGIKGFRQRKPLSRFPPTRYLYLLDKPFFFGLWVSTSIAFAGGVLMATMLQSDFLASIKEYAFSAVAASALIVAAIGLVVYFLLVWSGPRLPKSLRVVSAPLVRRAGDGRAG